MTSAEQWLPAKHNCEVSVDWIQQIQLDAMQEGMRRAAEVTRTWAQDDQCIQPSYTKLTAAILAAANNLTPKNL